MANYTITDCCKRCKYIIEANQLQRNQILMNSIRVGTSIGHKSCTRRWVLTYCCIRSCTAHPSRETCYQDIPKITYILKYTHIFRYILRCVKCRNIRLWGSAHNFDSEEDAREEVNRNHCNKEKSGYLEYCRTQINHTIVFHHPKTTNILSGWT